ncbi:substrate-binding domain-containing protein [Gordonia sp. TBRC 11910]|uniref:Substrate-binding domain-containing protein n=1 Tax=Gordonia asplenii TaxID=2725283 RepID=A0A848KMS0_9ACTN|nr:LacI family DNA-binding transcriptional regulator [Gordonia asplenii]NMO00374.1 substrate-binding domain-containing protein [Gordonia asplenii]
MGARAGRRPTLADVAERAGMSKAAVSMVLNDRPDSRLSADAADRIRAAADELGYRPNPAAQSLRLGKTRTIGFVSDEVTVTRFASGMIRGVLDAAREHGYTVLMSETAGGHDLSDAVQSMTDRRVDGLLIGLMAARLIDVPAVPAGLPLVLVNGISPDGHASVLPDERVAGEDVAHHLLDRGHREIGIIGDLPDVASDPRRSATIAERFDGITKTLAGAGVDAIRLDVSAWQPGVGYDSTCRLLDAHPGLTALIAGNDSVAFGIYQALTERGLRVGHDVSVISFDDDEFAAYQRPGLTTARLPYEEMAKCGVDMLLGRRGPGQARIAMPLIVRDSVRDLGGAYASPGAAVT